MSFCKYLGFFRVLLSIEVFNNNSCYTSSEHHANQYPAQLSNQLKFDLTRHSSSDRKRERAEAEANSCELWR